MDCPVLIISRDRLVCLKDLIQWLESIDHTDIHIVDMASSYQPLLEYLHRSQYPVHYLKDNIGPRSLWPYIIQSICPYQYYVVTDPDILPDSLCPTDVFDYFHYLLQNYPLSKVGFGLKLDDLPDHYKFKEQVLNWESQFWRSEIIPGVYSAPIDTTFAMYRPGSHNFVLAPAARTGSPYVAHHMPWYIDSAHLTEEELYYREHASNTISSWTQDTLDAWYPL